MTAPTPDPVAELVAAFHCDFCAGYWQLAHPGEAHPEPAIGCPDVEDEDAE